MDTGIEKDVQQCNKLSRRSSRIVNRKYRKNNKTSNFINTSILGKKYKMEILHVLESIENHKISRYLCVTNCAFIQYKGNDMLAVDIRENPKESESVFIIAVQVKINGEKMNIGFVVSEIYEFYSQLKVVAVGSNNKNNKNNNNNKKKGVGKIWQIISF